MTESAQPTEASIPFEEFAAASPEEIVSLCQVLTSFGVRMGGDRHAVVSSEDGLFRAELCGGGGPIAYLQSRNVGDVLDFVTSLGQG